MIDKIKKYAVYFSLGAWVLGVSLPLIYFHAWHSVPLPQTDLRVENLLEDLGAELDRWQMLHFVDAACLCSNFVAQHLVERGPQAGLRERVIVLDTTKLEVSEALSAKDFEVQRLAAEEMARRYNITSVPALVVFDKQKRLRYYGGYSDRTIHKYTKIKDIEIYQELLAGRFPKDLPQFGCASSKELQAKLDPLRLKYEEKNP